MLSVTPVFPFPYSLTRVSQGTRAFTNLFKTRGSQQWVEVREVCLEGDSRAVLAQFSYFVCEETESRRTAAVCELGLDSYSNTSVDRAPGLQGTTLTCGL